MAMRTTDFHRLLGQLGCLSRRQRDVLRTRLAAPVARAAEGSGAVAMLNERVACRRCCPRCGSARVQRWGKVEGLQRLRCCACARTFNPLTGTPLARLRKRELWFDYARALEDGLSIRRAGHLLGVHYNTTFRWRHRWLENLRERKARALSGEVEAAVTVFTECRRERHGWTRVAIARGRADRTPSGGAATALVQPASLLQMPVLFICDRRGACTDAVLPAFNAAAVDSVVGPLIDPHQTTLYSNGAPVLRAVCRERRIVHCWPGGQAGRGNDSGTVHSRTVAGYRERLAIWMRRFNGIGSHYLESYLGWRRLIDRFADGLAPTRWLQLAIERPTANGDRTANGEDWSVIRDAKECDG
jgi:transposase-like protein